MNQHAVPFLSDKSTTGRANKRDSRWQRWSRWGIATGSRLAPDLAERWATHLFTTPEHTPAPEADQALLATARPFRVGRRAAWQWGRGRPVLLVHGWGGRGADLARFAAPLVERGFSVITFDAPAHGVSPGFRATIGDFADMIAAVTERVGAPAAIVAHSFGGLAALLALKRGLETCSVVLIAPPSPQSRVERFARELEVPAPIVDGMMRRMEADLGERLEDVEARALSRDLRVPALVVHDRDDREVPWQASAALVRDWEGATLSRTEGLGHRGILRDASVAASVADFVARHAA